MSADTAKRDTIICRTGKLHYRLSKFISAIFCGAILCALGYLLFSAAVYAIFPNASALSPEQAEMLASCNISYLKKLLETVIMGAGAAVLPFLVCVFTANQYFCICIPFLLQYMQMTAANKLIFDSVSDCPEWQRALIMAVYPNSLRGIAYCTPTGIFSLIGYTFLAAAALTLFIITARRCTDCGR